MRILMIQPNYHSGGAEIAGNWPSSWVPYVGGPQVLRKFVLSMPCVTTLVMWN